MPRSENKSTPRVESGYLYSDAESFPLTSPRWQSWLTNAKTFYFESPAGTFIARKEPRRSGHFEKPYWYAYRHQGRKVHKCYLGLSEQLTAQRLADVAQQIADMVQS